MKKFKAPKAPKVKFPARPTCVKGSTTKTGKTVSAHLRGFKSKVQ